MMSYECVKTYGRVLWQFWGFALGANVEGGYFVRFRRKIGKLRWRRVSGVEGKKGKATNVKPLLWT